jgi:hypothetical protein
VQLAGALLPAAGRRPDASGPPTAGAVGRVPRAATAGPSVPFQLASTAVPFEPALPSRIPTKLKQTAPPMIARPTAPIPLMEAQFAEATDAKADEVGINVRLDVPEPQREVSAPLIPRQREKLRKAALRQFGGSEQTEKAVAGGLRWLARFQEADGRWSASNRRANRRIRPRSGIDSALTGLGLLSFLGQGHTHQKAGPYRANVKKAIDWLLKIQKVDGDLRWRGRMYSHAIATIALCEAYALSGDPELEGPCRSAVKFIVKAMAPRLWGWRYVPRQRGDTSVVGWCVMALKSAEMAGLKVPPVAWKNASTFLDRVSAGRHRGHYGYTGPSTGHPALTCEGLFCRVLMGESPDTKRNQESIAVAMKHLPTVRRGRHNFYLYYYASLALHYAGAEQWPKWNQALQQVLLKTQNQKKDMAGSWEGNVQWGHRGGRIYATTMAVLMLEVYYRYLPMYRHGGKSPAKSVAAGGSAKPR